MTSKEALEYLTSKVFTGGNSILETEAEICANVIKQDLERLKALEKENKEYFEIITKQAYLLNNKHIDRPFIEILQQENEKLKKAIEIIKNKLELEFNLDEYWKGVHYHLWSENGCEITKQEYELLKEVLDNESNNT